MAQDSLNVSGNPQNEATPKGIRTRSRFPLSYHIFATHHFGLYEPHLVFDGVADDHVAFGGSQRVDSYSLNAPLMQDVAIKKDYYEVPMEAILPKNWDKWFTNPVQGDDCPDDVGTSCDKFWYSAGLACNQLLTNFRSILSGTGTEQVKLTAFFRFAITLEYLYSNGNLLTYLGCHGSPKFKAASASLSYYTEHSTFDEWFDVVCAKLLNSNNGLDEFQMQVGSRTYYVPCSRSIQSLTSRNSNPCITFRDALNYFRDDLTASVTSVTFIGSGDCSTLITPYVSSSNFTFSFGTYNDSPLDLRRVWAYQLVVSHFYSNDHVDYVYSAELYRELIAFYLRQMSSTIQTFSVNGLTYEYDYLSGHNVARVWSLLRTNASDYLQNASTLAAGLLGYLSGVFALRRSLRYMDYFTGSRTRPLAVGDTNVDVQNGTPNFISVIDTTQKIQKQRFLNAVNRVGRKFEEYIKGIMGVEPNVDYHNPLYLSHTSDSVFAREVENTGSAQIALANSVTARFANSGGRYNFEFFLDRPAVVIGITYFDVMRVYKYSIDRHFFHVNRFDDFNPFMQFVGDQPVYTDELGMRRGPQHTTFSYQLRHMEYKQRYPYAVGGFVNSLPGYIFDSEADDGRFVASLEPDFIRSLPSELDRFYVSLTGYSLGTYFHFIVDHNNSCDASRPMAYAPSIL